MQRTLADTTENKKRRKITDEYDVSLLSFLYSSRTRSSGRKGGRKGIKGKEKQWLMPIVGHHRRYHRCYILHVITRFGWRATGPSRAFPRLTTVTVSFLVLTIPPSSFPLYYRFLVLATRDNLVSSYFGFATRRVCPLRKRLKSKRRNVGCGMFCRRTFGRMDLVSCGEMQNAPVRCHDENERERGRESRVHRHLSLLNPRCPGNPLI